MMGLCKKPMKIGLNEVSKQARVSSGAAIKINYVVKDVQNCVEHIKRPEVDLSGAQMKLRKSIEA